MSLRQVTVLGECVADAFADPASSSNELALRVLPGGGLANTAVALARLGTPARFLARLSGDVFGQGLGGRVVALRRPIAAGTAGPSGSASAPALSSRELDILSCVALGWTNSGIADQLGLRLETVKSYLRSAMRRLGCHSRLDVVVAARGLGLLP